jgi:hypothetical protein
MRNARSLAVDGRIGGHDPSRSSAGLPGRYRHRLLPFCCPAAPTLRTTRIAWGIILTREREGQRPTHSVALASDFRERLDVAGR